MPPVRRKEESVMNVKTLKLLCFITAVALISSCSMGLDREALKKGKNYFSGRVLKCGSRYFVMGYSITELDGFKYEINSIKLTEADRRNGIEWRGSIGFKAKLYRPLRNNSQWGGWETWNDNLYGFGIGPNGIKALSVTAIKKDGRWYVGENPWANDKSLAGMMASSFWKHMQLPKIDVSCSQLPK